MEKFYAFIIFNVDIGILLNPSAMQNVWLHSLVKPNKHVSYITLYDIEFIDTNVSADANVFKKSKLFGYVGSQSIIVLDTVEQSCRRNITMYPTVDILE